MRIIVIIVVMIIMAIMAITIIMVLIVIIDTGRGTRHLHPFTAVRIAPSNNPGPAKNECVNERILIVRECRWKNPA